MSYHSKVSRYKINIQKSITPLYTSNEQVKFEIKNTVSLTLVSKIMKCWDINLAKMYKIYICMMTKLWEIVRAREHWGATVHGVTKSWT